MEHGVREALVAVSAASAVLWTRGLIVAQLADGRDQSSRDVTSAPTGAPPWKYVQIPSRPRAKDGRTEGEMLSVAALAMLGIGLFGPILALFLFGWWLRLAAFVFACIYGKSTFTEAAFGIRVATGKAKIRADAPNPARYRTAILWYIASEMAQFVAMLAVLIFPNTMLVLILSIVFMYVGYQGILQRYLLVRRPFEPRSLPELGRIQKFSSRKTSHSGRSSLWMKWPPGSRVVALKK